MRLTKSTCPSAETFVSSFFCYSFLFLIVRNAQSISQMANSIIIPLLLISFTVA